MAYELIETIEVGAGGVSSVVFSGIPQNGSDLQIKISNMRTSSYGSFAVRFNNDSAFNYKSVKVGAQGGYSVYSFIYNSGTRTSIGNYGPTPNTVELNISNYASNGNKSFSCDNANAYNPNPQDEVIAGWYDTSSGITSVEIGIDGTTAEGSVISLYKIY